MKLRFKQKFMSVAGKYEVLDEEGQVAYKVQGRIRVPKRYDVYDAQGKQLGCLKSKVWDFMPQFRLFIEDKEVGRVKKKFRLFSQAFDLNCNDWKVEGNVLGWNYSIMDSNNNLIAEMSKELWHMTDHYVLDIEDPDDALMVLMIVLAIDAEKEGK